MEQTEPTYRESVSVGWALFWRTVGSFMLLMFAMNGMLLYLFPELTRSGPPLWAALLPFILVTLLCTFIVMPYVVRDLFRSSFCGFHVRYVRESPDRRPP
jgi:hypothetical protein